MKKKLTILIVSIILVLLVLSTTTYALFFKQDKLENEETYTAGILDIVLENNEEGLGEVLRLANSLPITDEVGKKSKPYKFKIKNIGNLSYTFDLKMLSTTTSNQIDSNYIKVMIDDNEPVCLSSLASSIIASNLTLNPGDSKTMSVRLWLDEYTPNSQIGKVFSAKIVGDGKGSEYIDSSLKTLTKLGLTSKKGTPDFSKTATTDEGIYSAVDDYGKSYYFRGASTNNYVKFAGYYWRIIRINGDGTIRMIYDGTTAHNNGESSTDRQMSDNSFNAGYNKNSYIGYMYGNSSATTYEATHTNTNNSIIKTRVDNWYKTNIVDAGFSDKIADVIYCNDRSLDTTQGGNGIGNNITDYGANYRLYDNKLPKLTCSQKNDAFTVDDEVKGNGALTYPVGLVTADEVSMAGGTNDGYNDSYYLYTGKVYWTMSPLSFSGSYAIEFYVSDLGSLNAVNVESYYGIRPVISLKTDVELAGAGTKDDPFKVVTASDKTLTKLGLTAKEGTPNFANVATSDEGIYSAEDDYGKSYYFRGASTKNYVKFANKFWRIIRINGDGSIRMIYDGTTAHNNGASSTDRQIRMETFNDVYIYNAYLGYMYGTPGSNTYTAEHANTNNSTIKGAVDAWYKTNIVDKGFGEKIADVIYCNDRQISGGGNGNGGYDTYYQPYYRLYSNKIPKLTCGQKNDTFTVSDTIKGNGALTYPIGLITADEVSMAGGVYGEDNSSYYLYINNNYWTMSPRRFEYGGAREILVGSSGDLGDSTVNDEFGVRPVISLKSTFEFTGDGTINNPFMVK